MKSLSRVLLFATPWTVAYQAPPSMGFSRQEYWSGLPFPSPIHESENVKVKSSGCVQLLVTPWPAAYQAPPSMGFSRQEYWNGVPLPSPQYKIKSLKFEENFCFSITFNIHPAFHPRRWHLFINTLSLGSKSSPSMFSLGNIAQGKWNGLK